MPWESTMRSKREHKSEEDMAKIVISRFANSDTKMGVKYSLGGLYIHPLVKYVSKNALANMLKHFPKAIVVGKGIDHTKLQPSKAGVTFEHVIPVEVSYKILKDKYEADSLSEKFVKRMMKHLYIALITKEENKLLSKVRCSKSMPKGWRLPVKIDLLDPLVRYRYAGLNDDIWVQEFLA